jgi:phenylalanyl-tRNA synthetase beta chain
MRWLREYVATDLPAEEVAHLLTMSGTEVGHIDRVGAEWDRIVIGRIEEIARHENADNLFVAQVDVGAEQITLVTAASNLKAGDVVPVIRAGGRLSADRVVDARQFRGVMSEGMLASGDELRLSPDKDSIYVLEPDAPIGMDLRAFLADTVLDVELTPNRPDCLGIVGIAREVAVLTGSSLNVPRYSAPPGARPIAEVLKVFVDDSDLCPRYTGAYAEGIRIEPSPQWLQRRLYLCGMRAISNIVDVTNYVMLELGQPLHAFDADRLADATLRIRRARSGERITTIDGVERELPDDALLIADAREPVALAGIMGGIDSEISEATTRIVLESATFDRTNVRRTSRALRLSSEASKRFDKGLDPELPDVASARALSLMVELAGGSAATGLLDVRSDQGEPRTIRFASSDISGLLGQTYADEVIEGILQSLGFELQRNGKVFEAVVPTWRRDVEGKADIAEEIARIAGYDAIPTTLPAGRIPPPSEDPTLRWEEVARSALAAAGLQEVMTYSLVDPLATARLDAGAPEPLAAVNNDSIPIWNPMSVDHSRLRTSLLPCLFETVAANLRYTERASIFEIARVYLPPLAPLPNEKRRVAIAMAGRRLPESWGTDAAPYDFYDLKAAVEALFRALHVPGPILASGQADSIRSEWVHPGRGAAIRVETEAQPLGIMGQVHPRVATRFDIDSVELYAAEIDLARLLPLAREEIGVRALARFPAVERDLALIVGDGVPHDALATAIRTAAGPLLEDVSLFDVYRGAPVPEGHRSLAFALTFRSAERTLSEDEVVSALEAVERELATLFGATVRGK